MNFNKVIIIGRATRDPEIRTTPSGQTVASIGVATNRIWNDKNGEKQRKVEFHNVVAWGRLAEICSQYLTKGGIVLFEGRLETRSWEGQDGSKKSRTEIIAENMQLGPRTFLKSENEESSYESRESVKDDKNGNFKKKEEEIRIEDVPF